MQTSETHRIREGVGWGGEEEELPSPKRFCSAAKNEEAYANDFHFLKQLLTVD